MLHSWWLALSVASKIFASACAGIVAIAAALKPLKIFLHWCIEKHDEKILRILRQAEKAARMQHPSLTVALVPMLTGAIASDADRNNKAVRKSLLRLEKRRLVYEVTSDSWLLGERKAPIGPTDRLGGRFSGGRFSN